jgi:homopolymeric O-antigen transport system ATP-binding protein
MSEPVIDLADVSLCYRLAKQRIPSFKEYALHWVRGALSYEQLWALREVTLRVERGETLGIVGRNGAGKSTLLKVISRVLVPSRGRCTVRGRVAPILELGTGFDYELTGLENVYLSALMLGRRRREVTARERQIVEFSGLGDFVRTPIRSYSSGMLARLAFSVATAWPADVLILDEVLAVGDAEFLARSRERLAEFQRDVATLLLVSHRAPEILEACTRGVWLEGGRVRMDGRPLDVLGAYGSEAPGRASVHRLQPGQGVRS